MRRKHYILILLFLWWPVNNIHRFWNNAPSQWVQWYWFTQAKEDIQWYVHDICQTVSYAIILWAVWLYYTSTLRKDSDIGVAMGASCLIQFMDVVHYLGWHRRCEVILMLEGMILFYAALKIIIKHRKSIHHKHG